MHNGEYGKGSLQRVKSFDEGVKNKMYGAKNVHLRPQTKFRVGGEEFSELLVL